MISKKTFDARCLLTNTTLTKYAELIGADIGDTVRPYDIQNLFRLPLAQSRPRRMRIASSLERISEKKAEAVRKRERDMIRNILDKEGVAFTRLEVWLGDSSFGESRFVFTDGKFFGVYLPIDGKWRYREDKHGTESTERDRDPEYRG